MESGGGLVSSDTARLEYSYDPNTGSWFGGSWYRPTHRDHRGEGAEAEEVKPSFAMALASIYDQAEELLLSKQRDYGPDNIAKSPFGPIFGLLVRMYDKQARAVNLVSKGHQAEHESLEDTFIDLLNYSAIALLVLRGQWPGVKAGDW